MRDEMNLGAGSVAVLNVGAGDVRLSFDSANPAEVIRAARIVRDMLRRGYALLVEVEREGEKRFERALDFDEATTSYIIVDFDPTAGETVKENASADSITSREEAPEPKVKAKRGRPRKAVSASSTRAVAVGPSAGG